MHYSTKDFYCNAQGSKCLIIALRWLPAMAILLGKYEFS
jgi:hypothetical protein